MTRKRAPTVPGRLPLRLFAREATSGSASTLQDAVDFCDMNSGAGVTQQQERDDLAAFLRAP